MQQAAKRKIWTNNCAATPKKDSSNYQFYYVFRFASDNGKFFIHIIPPPTKNSNVVNLRFFYN